jgi:hypothetical protein
MPGPRQEYIEAFDEPPAEQAEETSAQAAEAAPPTPETPRRRSKGWTFTGIAAAAVTTVLAAVVAGQVIAHPGGPNAAQATGDAERQTDGEKAWRSEQRPTPDASEDTAGGPASASTDGEKARRSEQRPTPDASEDTAGGPAPASYDELMARQFTLDPGLKGSGKFDAVGGYTAPPAKGQRYRYRVDVEQGLGLDGEMFAEAVHKTLNDDRSWAHNGAAAFERVSSGQVDFVITLASPRTTGVWCAKSGLDTTIDNVSCDSASTERLMINAYRWAQGSETYGPDKMYAYRQMLINHEVGHRLGYGHTTCSKDGALAPVMQQQTKFLSHDGITCRPNPWPFPGV